MTEPTTSLVEFLSDNNSRVSCGDRWMVVRKENESTDASPIYAVYSRQYGQKKTRTLYEGMYLSTALQFLKDDK